MCADEQCEYYFNQDRCTDQNKQGRKKDITNLTIYLSRCEISICLVKRMLDNMLLQLVQESLEEAQFEKQICKDY